MKQINVTMFIAFSNVPKMMRDFFFGDAYHKIWCDTTKHYEITINDECDIDKMLFDIIDKTTSNYAWNNQQNNNENEFCVVAIMHNNDIYFAKNCAGADKIMTVSFGDKQLDTRKLNIKRREYVKNEDEEKAVI